jgi:hypothetical protein
MSTGANDEQNLKSTPRVGLVQDLSDLPVLRPLGPSFLPPFKFESGLKPIIQIMPVIDTAREVNLERSQTN